MAVLSIRALFINLITIIRKYWKRTDTGNGKINAKDVQRNIPLSLNYSSDREF